jgi:hypothetical protein
MLLAPELVVSSPLKTAESLQRPVDPERENPTHVSPYATQS